MTYEEATEWLKVEYENARCDECIEDEYVNALEMAIKALESQRWIPKNATNGDMIISLFPNLKYYVKGDRIMTTIGVASSFDLEWWNTPYREGDAE